MSTRSFASARDKAKKPRLSLSIESDYPHYSTMLFSHPPRELEKRNFQTECDFRRSFPDSQVPTWRNDTSDHQQKAIPDHFLKSQELRHHQDEVYRTCRPVRAPQWLSLPHHENRSDYAYRQSRTLPPIKKTVPTPASERILEPVQPGAHAILLPPLNSWDISDERESCPVNIAHLLNPTTKPLSTHHMDLEAPFHQGLHSEQHGIDATPLEPVPPGDSTRTYSSTCKQTNCTEPAYAPFIATASRPRSSLSTSFPPPAKASVFSPSTFDSSIFEGPSSSSITQNQYHMMILDTAQDPVQVPIDVQSTSTATNEKRKRNAIASHKFRQRREEKERKAYENTKRLEAIIREMAEEKDHYRKERDFFQNAALYNCIPVEPRPPSPSRRRQAGIMEQD